MILIFDNNTNWCSLIIISYNRSNRTQLSGHFYAVGAMRKGCLNPELEDDVLLSLGFDSLSSIQFFTRLQAGDKVLHSRMYKRVSKRNTFTVAYKDSKSNVKYGQIETFFKAPNSCSRLYGAVIRPMVKMGDDICEPHVVFGRQAHHIVTVGQPAKHSCILISLEDILEVCLYIQFDGSNIGYAIHFVNHVEKD